jgi:hypothetical protein
VIALCFLKHPALSQCLCTSADEDVTISSGWPKSFDFAGYNDEIWDLEPFDLNNDGTIDGYIVAGAADMGVPDGKNIAIKRLYPNGAEYTAGDWPLEPIDGQNSTDAAYAVELTTSGHILVCGSKRTNTKNPGGSKNKNVWVMKYNFDGSPASGWPAAGIEYGGDGDDEGFDIKEALDGNSYIIAGLATAGTDDVPSNAQGDGDYWVFQITTSGTLISNRNKVYFGTNTAKGNDYARSVIVNCTTGHYIVSGFCKSCAPEGDNHSQLLLLKIPTNFGAETSISYGYDINFPLLFDDFGSYNVIHSQQNFGGCSAGDGFISIGLQHPNPGCYGNNHDFWTVKTDGSLVADVNFDGQDGVGTGCVDADAGVAYGGFKKDNGHSIVQICDGYLLAGITLSNNKKATCSICLVECNHYDCTETATDDLWLVKISNEGELVWEESLGEGGNDGAYVIKRVSDNSYIIGGFIYNAASGNKDWYLVKFEIDGCTERLSNDGAIDQTLSIFPNPSDGSLTVSLRAPEKGQQKAIIEVFDVAGKVKLTDHAQINNGLLEKQLSINNFSAGFYRVKVTTDGIVYTANFIQTN